MADFSLTRTFDLSAQSVWTVASDPGNLARWLPTAQRSDASGGDLVQLQGDSHGHPYDLAASLRADPAARRLTWSATDGPPYEGWLQVSGDEARAEVTVHLSVSDQRPGAGQGAEIEVGMSEALTRLADAAGS